MKREEIEKLLKEAGVTDDKLKGTLDTILDQNGKDVEAEKDKVKAKEGELTTANNTIKGLQESIKKFEGVDIDKLKKDAEDLQTKYDTDIKAEQEKYKNLQRGYSLKEALRAEGALDPDYIVYKQGGVEKFAFGEDGKPIGLADILKPMKEASPSLFKTDDEEDKGGGNGGSSFSSGGPHGGGMDPELDKLSDEEYYAKLEQKGK